MGSANLLLGGADLSIDNFNFVGAITRPARNLIVGMTGFLPNPFNGIAQVLIGVGLIMASVMFLSKLLKQLMVGRAKDMLQATLGRGPIAGILAGILVTILVQSSSTTSSLMIPLAGSGILGASVIYPFQIGSGIGTSVTAVLAGSCCYGASSTACSSNWSSPFLF